MEPTYGYSSPSPFGRIERANRNKYEKITQEIDEKFQKYVSPRQALMKVQADNNDAKGVSGHFGDIEGSQEQPLTYDKVAQNIGEFHGNGNHFVTSEVTPHRGLTYSDLRKYLWS
jgi:hypothetical protein